jgi:hypothetical protein
VWVFSCRNHKVNFISKKTSNELIVDAAHVSESNEISSTSSDKKGVGKKILKTVGALGVAVIAIYLFLCFSIFILFNLFFLSI